MSRHIVAVDGIDGSGKSTFASRLVTALAAAGSHPVLVRVDDFRRIIDWSSADEATLYYERYFDLEAVGAVAQAFATDAMTLELPGFDGITGQPLPLRQVPLEPAAILVIEGVFIRRISFGTTPVSHIYLSAPGSVARQRLVARDVARGRPRDDIDRRLDRRYIPGQTRYHSECDPRGRADLVVDNSDYATPLLLFTGATPLPPFLSRVLPTLVSNRPG